MTMAKPYHEVLRARWTDEKRKRREILADYFGQRLIPAVVALGVTVGLVLAI